MLKNILGILLLGALLISTDLQGQKKYDKLLSKADNQYEYGDYTKAIKSLKKFQKKVVSKLGESNKYIPVYYLREAMYYWASGVVVGFDISINQAIATSEQFHGLDSEEHALNVKEAAYIYLLYGNYRKADSLIQISRNIMISNDITSEDVNAEIELARASILSGKGFYREAMDFINDKEDYFKTRAAERESYVDESGKLIARRLEEKEVIKRFAQYAKLITLKARTLGEMGELEGAYLAYEKARDWIAAERKWLGKDSYEYVENQFAFANFKVDNGLDPDELGTGMHREEGYSKILSTLKKGHNESHFLAADIYETTLTNYLINRKFAKYRNLKVEYKRSIEKNFKKNSLHYINLETLDFNSKLERDRTKDLENSANAILANTQTLPTNHKKTIQVLDFLYRIAIKDRNFSNGERYLNNMVEIQKDLYGDDAPKYHLAKIRLAHFYLAYTNKINEAEEIYQNSFFNIVRNEITPMHVDYIEILNNLAGLYIYRDEFEKAKSTLEEALTVSLKKFRDLEDIEYAKELERVASLQIDLGEYDLGEKNLNDVLEIYRKKRVKNDEYNLIYLIKANETQAKLLGIKGYFDDAEKLIVESQEMLEEAATLEGFNQFEAIDELASLYIFLGRYAESGELLDQLITEYESLYGTESGKIVNALINKGRLLMLEGNYTEAEQTITRADNIANEVFGERSTYAASTQLLVGELYMNIGDYEKSIDAIQKSVSIREERYGEDHIIAALAKSQLGVAKYYNGDSFEETEQIMEESRTTIKNKLGVTNPRYAEVSTNLAKVFITSGKEIEAIAALSQAESIWNDIAGRRGSRRNVNVGRINLLAGDVYYQQKNYSKAEEFYSKARDIFRRSLNEDHPEYVKALSKLSRVYYMEGDSRKSKETMELAIASYDNYIREFFKSLSEREKAKFWNRIRPDFEFYNTLAIKFRDEDKDAVGKVYNNALMTKALLLNSSIKIRQRILSSGDEELIESYGEWLKSKEELTKAMAMSQEALTENNVNLPGLNDKVEQLEKYLSTRSEDFSNELEESRVTWEDVRTSLKENEVALEMVRFRYFDHVFTDSIIYAVMYVKNDSRQKNPEVILINNGYDLENRYFKFHRNAINLRIRDPYSYDMYWKPIVGTIGNLATVYLSPDGVYNQINLESIPTEGDKYVIDNSNIILVSNTKELYLTQQRKGQEGDDTSTEALMFGNPQYYLSSTASNQWPQLPGTEREVSALRNLLSDGGVQSDYYTKDEATEEQIKSLASPQILHIATHGFFTPSTQLPMDMELNEAENAKNPLLRTGLIMSGGGDVLDKTAFNYNLESGILTAYEAMNLNLDQTDLVVLSACETGLGEISNGEGVYGLQRAFLVAGAETLIMSMFKVDDEATQKLMVNFYQKWMESGNKRESFVAAKKELRNEYKDPIYWGSFIMMGLDK